MIVENVNTHAHGDVHLGVLAHLRRRWSWSDRDGFGTLSPSCGACSTGFGEFWKVLFTVFSASDAGFGSTRRWPQRPVSCAAWRLASLGHRCVWCRKGSEYRTHDVSVRCEWRRELLSACVDRTLRCVQSHPIGRVRCAKCVSRTSLFCTRCWGFNVRYSTVLCPVYGSAAQAICWPDAGWASGALHLHVWCAVFWRGAIQVTVTIEWMRFKWWHMVAI
jgi:hypothetical protein